LVLDCQRGKVRIRRQAPGDAGGTEQAFHDAEVAWPGLDDADLRLLEPSPHARHRLERSEGIHEH
jgi:hypothetical protein